MQAEEQAGETRVLAAVSCVVRAMAPDLLAMDHVMGSIDALLDGYSTSSLVKIAASGDLPLFNTRLQRMHTACAAKRGVNKDIFTQFKLAKALEAAVKNGRLEIVKRILAEHPTRLPARGLHASAAATGNIEMLSWLLENRSDGLCISDQTAAGKVPRCCLREVYTRAIQSKKTHLVRWLWEHGYVVNQVCLKGAGNAAAATGDRETLQWLHNLNPRGAFTKAAIDSAAAAGYDDIVVFLMTNRWEGYSSKAVVGSLFGDHQGIFSVLRPSGLCEEDVTMEFMRNAAKHGSLKILELNLAGMDHPPKLRAAMVAASGNGQLEVVKWLVWYHKIKCHFEAIQRAVMNGQLAVLDWINDEECGEWSGAPLLGKNHPTLMDSAASSGQLDTLKWLHARRHEGCTKTAMDAAAAIGRLDIVKWLHRNRNEGCSIAAMTSAAEGGHLHVVKWLHKHRNEGCAPNAMDRAAANGHLRVVEWLHANRSEGCTTDAMDTAAMMGYLDIVEWLHEHRFEGCTTDAMDHAPVIVKKWLHHNRQEGCTFTAMSEPARRGDLDTLEFYRAYHPEVEVIYTIESAIEGGHKPILDWFKIHYPEHFDEAMHLHDSEDDERVRDAVSELFGFRVRRRNQRRVRIR